MAQITNPANYGCFGLWTESEHCTAHVHCQYCQGVETAHREWRDAQEVFFVPPKKDASGNWICPFGRKMLDIIAEDEARVLLEIERQATRWNEDYGPLLDGKAASAQVDTLAGLISRGVLQTEVAEKVAEIREIDLDAAG